MVTQIDGLAWDAIVYDIPLPKQQRKAAIAAAPDAKTADVEKTAASTPDESSTDKINVDKPAFMNGPPGTRRLLSNFKGHVGRGEICALMGASGAGKVRRRVQDLRARPLLTRSALSLPQTTALNVISARLGSTGTLSGQVTFDGKARDPTKWKRIVG